MSVSRRELTLLLPFLAIAEAQDAPTLGSHIYHPDQSIDLDGKEKKGGRIFYGKDHSGYRFEMHETVLAPGVAAHPPHKHVHEEIITMLEGTVEVNVEGRKQAAEKGSIIYYGSNQMHNLRNVGETPARYYVLELRGHEEA
jgi:quercetin dioxygenase-like cupin family protein